MNVNVYINYFLWIVAILALLIYLNGKYKNKFSIKYYSLFLSLLFIYIIGIAIAYLEGINFNNPIKFIYGDLSRSMILPLSFAFTVLVSRTRNIKYFENIISILALIFMAILFIYKLFGFNIFKDIIKLTTVQLYNTSFIGFFGFYLLEKKHYKIIARFIILISWFLAILSLAKWNFFIVLSFPILWIIIETKKMRTKKRIFLCITILIILVVVFLNFKTDIVRFSSKNVWESWESYWYARVMTPEGRILDGSRFKIWGDLLQQFLKNPLLGIGFGARPTFSDVEDHNMFIFFLIRFGIPLFCIFIVLLIKLIVHILNYQGISRINRLVLFALFVYFFLSASTGSCFGQMLNGLTVGGIIGIMLNPMSADIYKEKHDKSFNKENTIYSAC